VPQLEIRNSKFAARNWKLESRFADFKSFKSRILGFPFRSQIWRWMAGAGAAFAGLVAAHPLAAQGCALCYNTAAAAGGRGITALRHGILILMIPPVMIFGIVTFFTVRGRDRFNDEGTDFGQEEPAA
jgi:hypothetical protein